jgi:probable addiction module antidote protein
MAKIETQPWDVAQYLETEEDMAAYLEAAIEEGEPAFIAKTLGDIAKARGMSQIAKDTGLGRESLYKALSGQGNPTFATIYKVITALGLQLHVATAKQEAR